MEVLLPVLEKQENEKTANPERQMTSGKETHPMESVQDHAPTELKQLSKFCLLLKIPLPF